jgi:hypothetical protein
VQLFNQDDYFQQRQNFVSGVPIQKRKIIGVGEGVYAVRGDNDKVSILTSEDLQLEQIAKKFETTPGAILTNNGLIYGPEREVMVGGVLSKVRNVFDAMAGKAKGMEVTPTAGAIGALAKEQQDLQDFLAAWAGKDTSKKSQGSRVYTAAQGMLDEKISSAEVMNWVKTVYPGWNFRVEDTGKTRGLSRVLPWNWFDAYAEGDKERIVAWPGTRIQVQVSDGNLNLYHDARTGKVYDPGGKIVSDSLDELTNYVAGKTLEEVKKEAGGK